MQTSEQEMLQKGQGQAAETSCSSEEVLYKIDIPANRYDMLCLEGIARALNIFRGRIPSVHYTHGLPPGETLLSGAPAQGSKDTLGPTPSRELSTTWSRPPQ